VARTAAALEASADRCGREAEQKLSMVEGDAGPALKTMLIRTSCGFKASQALEIVAAASSLPLPPDADDRMLCTRARAADRKLTT
jgi:hypothetical protein